MSDVLLGDNNPVSDYNVDIVFVIDGTGSMGPVIGEVKNKAIRFYEDLKSVMEEQGRTIDSLRIKVVVFRDYYCDSPDVCMKQSKFFNLPAESENFRNFVSEIEAGGGGDAPETSLEALKYAIDSDWSDGRKGRHVVVLFTDTSAHPLDKEPKPYHYPENMPRDLTELMILWEQDMNMEAKRLLIFAPEVYPWYEISEEWQQCIFVPSKAGEGLGDKDWDSIIQVIANSIVR